MSQISTTTAVSASIRNVLGQTFKKKNIKIQYGLRPNPTITKHMSGILTVISANRAYCIEGCSKCFETGTMGVGETLKGAEFTLVLPPDDEERG